MHRQPWQTRSAERLPDGQWQAAVTRVRSEFEEMACLSVTPEQACLLFGLPGNASGWVLGRLAGEGFLTQMPNGQFIRRQTAP